VAVETLNEPRIGIPAATLPRLNVATATKIRRLRPLRLIQLVLAVTFLAFITNAFARAAIDWSVVREYLFASTTFIGLGFTILMTIVAMCRSRSMTRWCRSPRALGARLRSSIRRRRAATSGRSSATSSTAAFRP